MGMKIVKDKVSAGFIVNKGDKPKAGYPTILGHLQCYTKIYYIFYYKIE